MRRRVAVRGRTSQRVRRRLGLWPMRTKGPRRRPQGRRAGRPAEATSGTANWETAAATSGAANWETAAATSGAANWEIAAAASGRLRRRRTGSLRRRRTGIRRWCGERRAALMGTLMRVTAGRGCACASGFGRRCEEVRRRACSVSEGESW